MLDPATGDQRLASLAFDFSPKAVEMFESSEAKC